MIRGSVRAAVSVAALVLISSGSVSAQQTAVTTPQQGKPVATSPKPAKPVSITPRPSDDGRVVPQGFSVVLVLADLTASNAQDDVPPAARRALADMKDFLPYKSYKLLDAAWLLGQGSMGVRLRGPEEQEYELRLQASPYAAASGRVSVQFSLRDSQSHESELEAVLAAQQAASRADVAAQGRNQELTVARLETELKQAREKGDEAKVRSIQRAIEQARNKQGQQSTARRKASFGRAIIDTTFMMDVGETVVVGTSRLRGNSRALIALLTAVPPKGSRTPSETR
jgi:hypothetical protein